MLQRYLIIWLVLSSWVALMWQRWFPGLLDPFVASKPLLPWLITVTMFAIGCMLPRDEVRQVLRRWPLVLSGTAVQYLSMPTLAYCFAHAWGLSGDYLIGLLLVGCVPGAMASNVLTFNARGNTSYSVSLTTASTLLSPLAVPIALGVAAHAQQQIDAQQLLETAVSLLLTVVIPVISGHLLTRRFAGFGSRAVRLGPTVANLTILWIIAAVVGLGRERLLGVDSSVPLARLFGALISVNLAGYLAGYFSGVLLRLPEPMRRALTLEIGMQNAGLGATLATQLFTSEAVALAPAMYTFGCMLTGTVLANIWSLRPPGPSSR